MFAFTIPILVTLIAWSILGIYPFGPRSVLSGDLLGQYDAITNYVRNNLFNGGLLFSNSVGLGINFFPILCYYVMSPINVIALFFKTPTIPLFFQLNILLNIGLISSSTFVYLNKSEFVSIKKNNHFTAYIGAVMFSLSAYVISYQQCVMWMDSIILFPLILLGFEKIISNVGGGQSLYYWSLVIAIISNYYIGLIIVIFLFYLSVFWLFYAHKEEKFIRRACDLIITTVLSLLSSSVVLIPSYLCQRDVNQASIKFSLYKVFSIKEAVTMFLINRNFGTCTILFSSILVLYFMILYLFNKEISKRTRIYSLTFLVFLLMSTWISLPYMIWHMFTMPNGFPQRESFTIAFCLIAIVIKQMQFENFPKCLILLALIITCITSIFQYKFDGEDEKLFIANVSFGILYVFILSLNRIKVRNLVTIIVVCLECLVSSVFTNSTTAFANYSAYYTLSKYQQNSVNKIKSHDSKDFYRIGNYLQLNANDPMNFNYSGLSGYVSQQPTKMTDYMSFLGYYQKHSWYRWSEYNSGSTRAIDSLLGVKYMISGNSRLYGLSREINSSPTYNNPVSAFKMKSMYPSDIYVNKFSLPPIFNSSSARISSEYLPKLDPFVRYNQLFSKLHVNRLYIPVTGINSQYIRSGVQSIDGDTNSKGLVYVYISRDKDTLLKNIIFTVNGKAYHYAGDNDNGENGILCLGRFKPNQRLKLTVQSNESAQYKLYCYQEDESKLSDLYNREYHAYKKLHHVNFGNGQIKFDTDSDFSGSNLVVPIFYQDGWQANINGKEAKLKKNLGGLLGIKVPRGANNVVLKYHVPGLLLGELLSILSIVLMILYSFSVKKLNSFSKSIER